MSQPPPTEEEIPPFAPLPKQFKDMMLYQSILHLEPVFDGNHVFRLPTEDFRNTDVKSQRNRSLNKKTSTTDTSATNPNPLSILSAASAAALIYIPPPRKPYERKKKKKFPIDGFSPETVPLGDIRRTYPKLLEQMIHRADIDSIIKRLKKMVALEDEFILTISCVENENSFGPIYREFIGIKAAANFLHIQSQTIPDQVLLIESMKFFKHKSQHSQIRCDLVYAGCLVYKMIIEYPEVAIDFNLAVIGLQGLQQREQQEQEQEQEQQMIGYESSLSLTDPSQRVMTGTALTTTTIMTEQEEEEEEGGELEEEVVEGEDTVEGRRVDDNQLPHIKVPRIQQQLDIQQQGRDEGRVKSTNNNRLFYSGVDAGKENDKQDFADQIHEKSYQQHDIDIVEEEEEEEEDHDEVVAEDNNDEDGEDDRMIMMTTKSTEEDGEEDDSEQISYQYNNNTIYNNHNRFNQTSFSSSSIPWNSLSQDERTFPLHLSNMNTMESSSSQLIGRKIVKVGDTTELIIGEHENPNLYQQAIVASEKTSFRVGEKSETIRSFRTNGTAIFHVDIDKKVIKLDLFYAAKQSMDSSKYEQTTST
jgi:hypothetical protein